jgi:hypothetical protein
VLSEENGQETLDQYRNWENQLHLELMNSCRRYITKLGIVSIVGILDVVKQETIELEKATRKSFQENENQGQQSQSFDKF